jgi:multicomponent Na+:H+ antiporter subunit C
MTGLQVHTVVAMLLVAVALYGLLSQANLVRKVLALNIMGSAVFLLFTALAARGSPPDPVPHALVITGIVVSVAVTSFALAMVRRLHAETGRLTLEDEE